MESCLMGGMLPEEENQSDENGKNAGSGNP
jgi:hypothetical protein